MARYRRRRYYRKRKYNLETRPISVTSSSTLQNGYYQAQTLIVPPSVTEGVRQVARMTITLTGSFNGERPFFWALVYIPEGAVTSSLFPSSDTLFNPSNYVLASGVSDPDAGPVRISSRLRKNLNANDQIYLLTATSVQSAQLIGLVRYAICYN